MLRFALSTIFPGVPGSELIDYYDYNQNKIDCKTVRIFAYSSTREQSNKRCGMRLKTEGENGDSRASRA